MNGLFPIDDFETKKKVRRREDTSHFKQRLDKDIVSAQKAHQDIVRFINQSKDMKIKRVLEAMSGGGMYTNSLLNIEGLEEIILNDFSEDCYSYLKNRFKDNPKVKDIWNLDFYTIDLKQVGKIDLLVIDFNTFTWHKKEQVDKFLYWLKNNRKYFSYLVYSDSFYYSLKFVKDEEVRNKKYEEYLKKVQEYLNMELLYNHVFGSKNCSILVLENEE